ncbi:phosphate regulon sensor histidine kinase PhoR [Denitromonas ohlonensis]|uniref:phosphate regulon sensor histidine kinase PhoR n=1 Tax=Denitromonas ohlonensis TaxID=3078508 RepID=UPI0021B23A9B|nr:phosphate regulon sensor histidine kinase PhoR [Denitromonas ohlonensis]
MADRGFAIHTARYVWTALAGALAVLAIVATLCAILISPLLGSLVALGGVLWMLFQHHAHLARLVRWAHRPIGQAPLPQASGLWDLVYSDLNRNVRQASTERAKLSAELARFRDASQAMPDGVMYLSLTGSIEWINRRAAEDLGLDLARDRGAPITNLVRQPDFVHYLEAGDYSEPFLFHPVRRKGAALLVQVITFGDGRRMVISRDVTQIEKLETMRRDFVANVSHELRTPLTVVSGFIETVLDGLDDVPREDVLRYLGMAHEQAARMQRLIQDLLMLSALETGAPQPVEDVFDVVGLVREVARETEALSAGRHQVTVVASDMCRIQGSAKELHSAFANLASNAIRYSPNGGEIQLRWRLLESGAGEFCVSDNGIGIAPEHIPRLTERFYRVDRGRSRETGGTGLGLAIVKHVLTRHQAELKITSDPGEGSCFCAVLPARRIAPTRS